MNTSASPYSFAVFFISKCFFADKNLLGPALLARCGVLLCLHLKNPWREFLFYQNFDWLTWLLYLIPYIMHIYAFIFNNFFSICFFCFAICFISPKLLLLFCLFPIVEKTDTVTHCNTVRHYRGIVTLWDIIVAL